MAVACCVNAFRHVLLPAFISPKSPMTGRGSTEVDDEEEKKKEEEERERHRSVRSGL